MAIISYYSSHKKEKNNDILEHWTVPVILIKHKFTNGYEISLYNLTDKQNIFINHYTLDIDLLYCHFGQQACKDMLEGQSLVS